MRESSFYATLSRLTIKTNGFRLVAKHATTGSSIDPVTNDSMFVPALNMFYVLLL